MMYLTFEGKKLLFSRYAIVLLLLLFIANGAVCFIQNNGYMELQEEFHEPDAIDRIIEDYIHDFDGLEEYRKEVDQAYEAYNKIVMDGFMQGLTDLEINEGSFKYTGTGRSLIEKKLIEEVYALVEKCNAYPNDLEDFIKENELRLNEKEPGSFVRAYAEETIGFYREFQAKGVGIGVERIKGWDRYFDYDLVNLFSLVAVMVLCCAVMLGDKTIGFYPILSATRNGRRKTVTAKMGLLLILTLLVSLLFSLSSFLIIGLRVGYSSAGNAIQAIDEFRFAPYAFTMGSYLFVQLGLRALTLCVFSMFICLIASALNNHVYTYFAGAAIIGLGFFVYTKDFVTPTNFIKVNNLFDLLLVNNQFTRYRAYEFFGKPLNNLLIVAIVFSFILILSFLFTPILLEKIGFTVKNPFARLRTRLYKIVRMRPRVRKPKTHSLHLAPYELKKIFYSPIVLILSLALAAGSVFLSYRAYETKPSFDTAAYNSYIDEIAGPMTKESKTYLNNESARLHAIVNNYEKVQQDYRDSKISIDEYLDYMNEYSEATMLLSILSRISTHTMYIKNHEQNTGQKTWYVHNLGWDRYFERGFDLCLYALVLFLFWGLFQTEFKRQSRGGSFNCIQSTTKNGREKTFFTKIITAFGIFTAIFAVCVTAELITFAHYCGLPELNAPLASIEAFDGVSADVSILAYMILSYFYKYSGFLLLILVTASISQFAKRPIPILTGTALLTIFPHLLVLLGMTGFRYIDFILLLDPHSLLRFSAEGYQPAAQGTLLFQIFPIAFAVVGLMCVGGAYCSFVKKRITIRELRRNEKYETCI